MAWQLVAEVLVHCPDLRYREFRVLVALAFDARVETRQCAPGWKQITLHANCGARTASRAVSRLHERNLIKTVERAAPHRQTVYEILPMPGTGDTMLTCVTDDSEMAHVTGDTMLSPERTSVPGQRTSVSSQRTTKKRRTHDSSLAPPTYIPTGTYVSLSARDQQRVILTGLGANERETEIIITRLENDPAIRDPAAYLSKVARNDGAAWLERERRAMSNGHAASRPARPEKPPWCGECDEETRMLDWHGDHPCPCPACNPNTPRRRTETPS